ncbi:unnamed protein product [Cochlearia groenlandica]
MKPHEDWVDGSWTVDCVCGVSFDDGKEMVNCDECGVWVHTWCSRYVKGDDMFACHKCKIKKKKKKKKEKEDDDDDDENNTRLYVTRALTMKNVLRQDMTVSRVDVPIEERVHVQGVPGGELDLFDCFPTVFSRQLWKCTGYVPKRFRTRYREFPCWDEKENLCEIVHQEDACGGGGGLLTISKEIDVVAPVVDVTNEEKLGVKDAISCEKKRCYRSDMYKEKSLLCHLSTNTEWKEEYDDDDDRIKKKVKVAEKEEEDEEIGFAKAM